MLKYLLFYLIRRIGILRMQQMNREYFVDIQTMNQR